ncbi:MAG: alpha/beta hydrolase [Aliishimia sp.]
MSSFTTSDGLKLHYEDTGEGLPILCLAGLTRTTRDFDYVTPHLPNNRLIKLDYRGRGQSEWASDFKTYAVPVECRDILELMAHLSLAQTAIIGTSRGGINAMGVAAAQPDAVLGVALNDVGPVIETSGLEVIMGYLGRNPAAKTFEDLANAMQHISPGFANMPEGRWLNEAKMHYTQGKDGLQITYDPKLRDAILPALEAPAPNLWPYFDALAGKPLALIWGANSDLLTADTVTAMQDRRPDMILAKVPDRAHIPFLDEPASLVALNAWLEKMA